MMLTPIQYHDRTAYERNKIPSHFLDWKNKPSLFKYYFKSDVVTLPREFLYSDSSLASLFQPYGLNKDQHAPTIDDLSLILGTAYGITAKSPSMNGQFYYRSVASAGALYPVEIYVATNTVIGLSDGLYHYSVAKHGLTPIRTKRIWKEAAAVLFEKPSAAPAIIFFLSVIFFRSSWKYKERAYRYHLLDSGHLLENLMIILRGQGLHPALTYDFEDKPVNRILGLDDHKEACLAMCAAPGGAILKKGGNERQIPDIVNLDKDASRVSDVEVDYPLILRMHRAGAKIVSDAYSFSVCKPRTDGPRALGIQKATLSARPERRSCRDTFLYRRSHRNFIQRSISQEQMTALLECMSDESTSQGYETSARSMPIDIGLIIENADGFSAGIHEWDPEKQTLCMTKEGRFAAKMAHICLDQKWLFNAAVLVLFYGDLEVLEQTWGTRGYRHVMMHAGRLGQRLYLESTALGLGCCGIGAFYDMEAATFLNRCGGNRLLYLVALGPVKSF